MVAYVVPKQALFYAWELRCLQKPCYPGSPRSHDPRMVFEVVARIPWVLPPLSNSWIISIIWVFIALKRTPNIDCYWVGAVPKGYQPCTCPNSDALVLGVLHATPKPRLNLAHNSILWYIMVYYFRFEVLFHESMGTQIM